MSRTRRLSCFRRYRLRDEHQSWPPLDAGFTKAQDSASIAEKIGTSSRLADDRRPPSQGNVIALRLQ